MRTTCAVALAVCLLASPLRAEVLDASPAGFTVSAAVEVGAPPGRVYDALVTRIAAWWDAAHSWSGSSANLSIDARAGGCFCEALPGGGVRHMTVIYVDRARMLRMSGGLGPLQGMAVTGVMTFTFTENAGGAHVEATYTVGGYAKDGLTDLAPAVDRVIVEQVARLKRYVEIGKP